MYINIIRIILNYGGKNAANTEVENYRLSFNC